MATIRSIADRLNWALTDAAAEKNADKLQEMGPETPDCPSILPSWIPATQEAHNKEDTGTQS